MNFRNLLSSICVVLLLSSCSTTFYQLYNVKPINESLNKSELLFFEDENCKITYDLWSNGGNIGFNFYNKTESKIYVQLNESNFILNGLAYDYFQNRTFTRSGSKASSTFNSSPSSVNATGRNVYTTKKTNQVKGLSSTSLSSSLGYAVSKREDSILCIPSKTTKRVSEYSINDLLIRNCGLFKYPTKKQINTISYTEDQSPIVFSNRITYQINSNINEVRNEFYVAEITNYPRSEFIETKYEEFCGQKSSYPKKYFKHYDTDKFYLKYSYGSDYRKH